MEEYFYGYSVQRRHQLRSATKAVVSTLAGIAIDQGALSGVDERVLPQMSYANYANPDPRKATMTLGNFLSMSSGLDCNDHSSTSPGRETVIDNAPDWVKATLDLPMINDPGTRAYYCSGGVSVVGRLMENAVHMRLPEFAQANLFGPLGISRADWTWNYDLTNADKEYSQIHLRPPDMLKLGVLFADGGGRGAVHDCRCAGDAEPQACAATSACAKSPMASSSRKQMSRSFMRTTRTNSNGPNACGRRIS